MWLWWRTEFVVWKRNCFFKPNHEGLVEALRIQADEEEAVGLACGRLPHGFEGVLIDQRRTLTFDGLVLLVIPHLECQEARGVDPTRRGYQSELLNR